MIPVQHIAITAADGSLLIMSFILEDARQGWKREATPENVAAEIAKASLDWASPAASWRLIASDEIPKSREFRAAWTDTGRGIEHDMSKARALCLERLRLERNQKLDDLDRDWMKASGQKDAPAADAVEAQRQTLRDFPTAIAATLDAALTVEDLKQIKLPE